MGVVLVPVVLAPLAETLAPASGMLAPGNSWRHSCSKNSSMSLLFLHTKIKVWNCRTIDARSSLYSRSVSTMATHSFYELII